jgi:hypothetical protein
MAKQFTLPTILRHVSNRLIRDYFKSVNVELDLKWDDCSETEVAPIFEAWKALTPEDRLRTERDLQDVFFLGSDAGTLNLRAASVDTGEALPEGFDKCDDPYDRAMSVLINSPRTWKFVQAFLPIDQLQNKRFWRRYRDLPQQKITDPESKATQLAEAISQTMWANEGHGQTHKAEYHSRGDRADYFSVFLDDLPQRDVYLDENRQFQRNPHPRVAEFAFIWHPQDGVARVYVERDAKSARMLFELFYRIVFGVEPPTEDVRKTAFRLNRLLEPDFKFAWSASEGIKGVAVKKIRLSHKADRARRITLEGNVDGRGDRDVFVMLDRFLNKSELPRELIDISLVTLTIALQPGRYGRRKSLTFDLNWPNGGNLHNQPSELQALGQRCLDQWKIDVTPCENEDAWSMILDLAEQSDEKLDADSCDQWPIGLRATLEADGILLPDEPAKQVLCWACGEAHPVLTETIDHEPGVRYRMACPYGQGAEIIDAARLDRWRISVEGLIRRVRAALRLKSDVRVVIENHVWCLGQSTLSGLDGKIYFARGPLDSYVDEGGHPFEANAIVIVPNHVAASPIFVRHNIRFVRVSQFLIYGTEGLVATLDQLLGELGIRSEEPGNILEPWRFTRPDQFVIAGNAYRCDLTNKQQSLAEFASGKMTVPLTTFFSGNGSAVWKERLTGAKGTERQRSKVTTAINRLNTKLLNAKIPMFFELPRDSYDLHIRLSEGLKN